MRALPRGQSYELPLTFRKMRNVRVTTLRLLHDAPPIVLPRYASTAFARFEQIAPLRLRVEPYAASVDVSDLPNTNVPGVSDEVVEWVSDEVVDRVQGAKDDIGLGGITIGLHDGRFRGTSVKHWASGLLDLVDDPAAQADAYRPLQSAGHELMHQLGFDHAGPDYPDVEGAEDWPPDDQGKIRGWGLDPRLTDADRPPPRLRRQEPGPFEPAVEDSRYDLMSYCARGEGKAWFSVRNWTRLLLRG